MSFEGASEPPVVVAHMQRADEEDVEYSDDWPGRYSETMHTAAKAEQDLSQKQRVPRKGQVCQSPRAFRQKQRWQKSDTDPDQREEEAAASMGAGAALAATRKGQKEEGRQDKNAEDEERCEETEKARGRGS